jgi:toxin ParE1/3/4
MPHVRYSSRALKDLDEIASYTLNNWGERQTESYLDSLQSICLLLSSKPHMGRPFGPIRPNWLRWEHESHIIFYRILPDGIRVQRIVHQRRALEKLLR